MLLRLLKVGKSTGHVYGRASLCGPDRTSGTRRDTKLIEKMLSTAYAVPFPCCPLARNGLSLMVNVLTLSVFD